jgi:hypothetical protein
MGDERDSQDPLKGPEQSPKLSLAGRIDGSVCGRPFSLTAENRVVTLAVDRFGTLVSFRRSWQSAIQPLLELFRRAGLRLVVRVPWLGTLELFPNPGCLTRLLLRT